MKKKSLIIGGVLVVGIGIGIFAIFKSSGAGGGDDDESSGENIPTIVTVQTAALKRMTLHNCVSGYGTIEAAPATETEPAAGGTLAAPSAGVVVKVNVIAGQRVEKGNVLVELNSATATFEYAKAELERQKQLFAQQNTSQKSLQDAQAQLASLEIVAPVNGTVTRLNVKPGEAVDVNTIVAEVIDLNRLAVSAKISAADAGELKEGDEVQILSQPPTTALLAIVSPSVDSNDGTISIWTTLSADSGLKPGQFVPLKIITAVHTNCLAAPGESIVTDENGNSVIAVVKGDEATQTSVKIGLREDNWVEVAGTNLNAGDSVVTVGAYGLPEKTKIHLANSPEEKNSATNSAEAQ
jgi:membrane fusion protein (multidrug efflux system)